MIYDNLGNEWKVVKGDAAWKTIQTLQKLGFEYIVLTVPILCGNMRGEKREDIDIEAKEIDIRKKVRLYDCLLALGVLEK